jgi:acetylornithine aminotransferase
MRKASNNLQSRWNDAMEQNYGSPKISLVKGKGSYVWDESGKKYLDFLGGIATNILGQANPAIVRAASQQIATLGHTSNLYSHPQGILLAEKLQAMIGAPSKVFFCNSGAEANEAALKISRLTGRTRIISTEGSFHGRTMGALSLTGQPAKRAPFIPLMRDVKFVPFGEILSMERAISKKVAMVIVEPIQGENGVVTPPKGYLKGLRELCDRFGVLLAIDAVQTGMGRTGEWFGYESEEITPDVLTLAKGLGGGLSLGAMITIGDRTPHFSTGQHGSTFGGNPVSTAAGLATIREVESKKLMKNALAMEKILRRELSQIGEIEQVRGKGLLLGIVLKEKIAQEVVQAAALQGLLVNAPSDSVIRIAPALNISRVQAIEFVKRFKAALKMVTADE